MHVKRERESGRERERESERELERERERQRERQRGRETQNHTLLLIHLYDCQYTHSQSHNVGTRAHRYS